MEQPIGGLLDVCMITTINDSLPLSISEAVSIAKCPIVQAGQAKTERACLCLRGECQILYYNDAAQ